jgi:fumarylacetoacetase
VVGTSWVAIPDGSPFPLENLPFGIFSVSGGAPRVGVALGSHVIDLVHLANGGWLQDAGGVWDHESLNPFLATGPATWAAVRRRLGELLSDGAWRQTVSAALLPMAEVTLHLPFEVADFVDFYSFVDHAQNVGRIFRPGADPLTANWRHIPIGYHGRAGTVVVSGTPITRPSGQSLATTASTPTFGPSSRLDFEAEVGFVVGVGTRLGQPVTAARFADHVFGAVLVNDWSARDLQAWEYVPLGPFLGKSFATSISPWVVPLEALAPSRVAAPAQDPAPLAYLRDPDPWSLDLTLEVRLNGHLLSRPPFRAMYWTPGQQLAHLTASGASLRTGDLFASGTVSGPEPDQWGSLIELTSNGSRPLYLPDGTKRTYLADGDTVSITAWTGGDDGSRIGFGPLLGTVTPARR